MARSTLPNDSHVHAELAVRELARTWDRMQGRLKPYFELHGISGAQWGVLRTLSRAERAGIPPLRLTDLGERLLVRPPSVTAVVNRLEEMRLVVRRSDASDQRAKTVELTRAGRALLARVEKRHPARMRELLDGLADAEVRTLHRLLQRVADRLEQDARQRRRRSTR